MNKILLLLLFSCSLHSEFSSLATLEVPEKILPNLDKHYILPNESTPSLFGIQKLENAEGLLVAVGTIRGLVIFTWAPKISHLWMTDYDSEVVNFNKRHLGFIRCLAEKYPANFLAQRIEYFANFHGYEIPRGEIEELARSPFIDLTRLRSSLLFKNKSTPENSCWAHAQLPQKEEFIAFNRHKSSTTLFGYTRFNEERFYWEDDEQWKKIVEAIVDNRIAASALDIVNDYSSMAEFIKRTGLNFGIFDVSNVPSPNFLANPLSWADAINQAPIKPNLVLFTILMSRNSFGYHAFELPRFILHLQIGRSLR